MIQFNIIGKGFLDVEDDGSIGFKTENQQFRFCDIGLGRSVEFSVPASDWNRSLLGYSEDPAERGEIMRRSNDCQMVYDGGLINGTLNITGYEQEAFKCVFFMENAEWINALQNRKLADCITTWNKGVLWSSNNTPMDANDPALDTLTEGNVLLQYENGMIAQTPNWQLVPCINIALYIDDILTQLGAPHTIGIPKNYWLVTNSMKGGESDTVTLAATNNTNASIVQTQGYLSTMDDYVYASRNVFFGIYAVTTNQCRWFKAEQNLQITLPTTFPSDVMMVGYVEKSTRPEYGAYGGRWYNPTFGGWIGEPLAGRTIEVKKGAAFQFFKPNTQYEFGFTTVDVPFSYQCEVKRTDDLSIGEVWYLRYNQPDMTVFEFLKSVCLATGYELLVSADNGIVIKRGQYGVDFKECTGVISVNSVARNVGVWGNDTNTARIVFDSEDYVTERIETDYMIPNETLSKVEDKKVAFSEGAVGSRGILIEDWQAQSGGLYKIKAKKMTIAYADQNEAFLQRVAPPDEIGYNDIANESTNVKLSMLKPLAEFFDLKLTDVWLWRGVAYVWTDAEWTDGVLTLTLQKVSQQYVSAGAE